MRVVVAEDLVLLRDGIARALEGAGIRVVAQAGDAGGLIDAVVEHRPDLAIVDVRMPPTFTDEGARAARLLHARYPGLAVLILSHSIDPDLAMGLARERPDGFGYLLKDRILEVATFLGAVRRVGSGGTVVDEDVVDYCLAREANAVAALTGREREVLALLARGLSNTAISAALFVSERTVDAHLRAIFVKLGLPQDPDANRRVQAAVAWLAAPHPLSGAGTDVGFDGGS